MKAGKHELKPKLNRLKQQLEPMQMIMGEMSQPEPDEHRLMMFQHMLVKTPQWQQFLQTIPKNQREQMKGIDILAMITQSIHQESNMLAPQF